MFTTNYLTNKRILYAYVNMDVRESNLDKVRQSIVQFHLTWILVLHLVMDQIF